MYYTQDHDSAYNTHTRSRDPAYNMHTQSRDPEYNTHTQSQKCILGVRMSNFGGLSVPVKRSNEKNCFHKLVVLLFLCLKRVFKFDFFNPFFTLHIIHIRRVNSGYEYLCEINKELKTVLACLSGTQMK